MTFAILAIHFDIPRIVTSWIALACQNHDADFLKVSPARRDRHAMAAFQYMKVPRYAPKKRAATIVKMYSNLSKLMLTSRLMLR